MKQISQQQIDAILDTFYKLNAPVQVYSQLQKLLSELPEVKKEVKK
jgi:hypothetical protein